MSFYVDMIHVGNADALMIVLGEPPNRIGVLVDAGDNEPHPLHPNLEFYLRHCLPMDLQNRVNLLVCTHIDDDHIGGVRALLDLEGAGGPSIGTIILNEVPGTNETFVPPADANFGNARPRTAPQAVFGLMVRRAQMTPSDDPVVCASISTFSDLCDYLESIGKTAIPAYAGSELLELAQCVSSDFRLEVIAPTSQDFVSMLNNAAVHLSAVDQPTSIVNNASIVFQICASGAPAALFPGDVDYEVLSAALAASSATGSYSLLKIPHHGSNAMLQDAAPVMQASQGGVAFIPAEAHRPTTEVIDELNSSGIPYYVSGDAPTGLAPFVTRFSYNSGDAACGPVDAAATTHYHGMSVRVFGR